MMGTLHQDAASVVEEATQRKSFRTLEIGPGTCYNGHVDEIFLVAADWQLRTLVRAQLLEEGYQVKAWPAVEPVLVHLLRGGQQPGLIILDAQGTDLEPQWVWDLWRLAGEAHLILCGGVMSRECLRRGDLPPAHLLLRPFSVGDVVERVRRLLP